LAALVERGSALVQLPDRFEEGHRLLLDVADAAEKHGEWLLASRALYNSRQEIGTPQEHAELLERMRVDAERAGHEATAVASYLDGQARLAMWPGDINTAIATLRRAYEREPVLDRPDPQRSLDLAVFLTVVYFEAGDLHVVEERIELIREFRPRGRGGHPDTADGTEPIEASECSPLLFPGLEFHLAC